MADIQESGPTQALDVPDYMADPDVAEEKPQPWGHLVSLNPKFPNVDLFDEIVLFGRGANCQVTYTDRSVSTNHLKIFRERIGSSKHECVVWLEDLRCATVAVVFFISIQIHFCRTATRRIAFPGPW
jgi:hypothetical protein